MNLNINKLINKIFKIGYHGPYILMVTSILMIIYEARIHFPILETAIIPYLHFVSNIGNKILLVIIWNTMNIGVNGLLKQLIKQSRPKKNITINKQDAIRSRGYGMPSGHAQTAASNLVFIALLFRNEVLTSLATLQVLLTIYQRYSFRMHTASQLFVGSIIGSASGYALYECYKFLFITPQSQAQSQAQSRAKATEEKNAPLPQPVATMSH